MAAIKSHTQSPLGAVWANSWAVKACDYVFLGRLQWTITDVEFKQWGMNSQIEQQQEIDIIADELLVKPFALPSCIFNTFKQQFWIF